MNKLYKTLAKTFLILIVFISVLLFIGATNSGLNLLVNSATKIVPGKISIKNLRGNLFSNITADEINYENNQLKIYIGQSKLKINLLEIFQSRVNLNELILSNVTIYSHLKPKSTQDSSSTDLQKYFNWFNYFKYMDLSKAKITNLAFKTDGLSKPVVINSVDFNLTHNTQNELFLKSEVKSTLLHVSISGTINDSTNLSWQINIPKLNDLIPNYTGEITASGGVTTDKSKISFATYLTVNNFSSPKVKTDKLVANINFNNSSENPSTFNLNLANLKIGNHRFSEKINIDGNIFFTDKSLSKINFHSNPFTIYPPTELNNSELNVEINNASYEVNKSGSSLIANLAIKNKAPILVKLELPKYFLNTWPSKTQKILGDLTWKTNNLDFVSNFYPEIKNLAGNLDLSLKISGILANIKLIANLELKDAHFVMDKLNITPYGINLTLNNDEKNLHYSLTGKSGEGELNISGETDLEKNNFPTTLRISGKNFLINDTKITHLSVSPSLTINLDTSKISTKGKVFINDSIFNDEADNQVTSLPKDVVILNGDKPEISLPSIDSYTDVTLVFGDRVKINKANIIGQIKGELVINETPKTPATTNGSLEVINAYYNLYGHHLEITPGSTLQFINSQLDNPFLNIRATRTIKNNYVEKENRIVGMRITGTADKPSVALFSDPSDLSNMNIFSYLILGQSSEQPSSQNNNQVLINAANALNLGTGGQLNSLMNEFQNALGLSQFGIETEESAAVPATINPDITQPQNQPITNTSIVLGKYLTPKLYISYSRGLIDPTNIFKISYILGKHWSIQTEGNNVDRGVDLFFHFERQ
jgi:translocation and assembly module TamB